MPFPKREDHWNAKLKTKQVDRIKTLCGYMQDRELALQYKVTKQLINMIRHERIWKHI